MLHFTYPVMIYEQFSLQILGYGLMDINRPHLTCDKCVVLLASMKSNMNHQIQR
jgi:hypothetical protein